MPRYDDSPMASHRDRGHSPLDRRDRRIKSPVSDRRRPRDSPPPPMRHQVSSRDPYDDYGRVKETGHRHESSSSSHSSIPYKILCVSNLNHKFSDNSIRDALLREFHRFGEPSVKLVQDGNERLAYLYFRCYDDARDARHAKSRLVLFDKGIVIDPIYDRVMSVPRRRSISPDYRSSSMRNSGGPPPSPPMQRRPPPPPPVRNNMDNNRMYMQSGHRDNYNRHDMHMSRGGGGGDYHHSGSGSGGGGGGGSQSGNRQQHRDSKKEKFPNYLHHIAPEEDDKATRTLFVGNLEVAISEADLRRIFERYGVVEDIDVKRPPPGQGNAYAFIKFLNLDMAHRAKVEMSGQYIGKFQCKIGYGKATPTTRIWVGGLGSWTSLSHLEREFDRFGAIRKIDFVKGDNHAYIQYDSIDAAQAACQEMRGFPLGGPDKRLRVDFADPGPYNYAPNYSPSRQSGTSAPAEAPPSGEHYNQPRRNDAEWPNQNTRYSGGKSGGDYDQNYDRNAPLRVVSGAGSEFEDRKDYQPGSGGNQNWNWWDESGQGSPNADRRGKRPRTPDGDPERAKRVARKSSVSPNGLQQDSLTSPRMSRGSIGRRTPDFDANGQEPKVVINESVTTLTELVKCCPPAWSGGLILKNSAFPSRMLFCSGDLTLVDLLMKDPNSETSLLRITQRLRLDPPKLEDVTRRMNLAGNSGFCMLLTMTGSAQVLQLGEQAGEDGNKLQQRPLRNLVTYLKQKDAAGVITLTGGPKDGKELVGVLYAFPPCPFAVELLKRVAPNLTCENSKEEYLVVVVVRGAN